MAHTLPVESIMHTGTPVNCPPDTALYQAARMMSDHACSSIIVMDQGRPIGIWTERDALLVDFSRPESLQMPVAEAMSSPVVSVRAGTTVAEAASRFHQEGLRHLLVRDDEDRVMGILTQSDIALNQGLEPYLKLREVHTALPQSQLMLPGELRLSEAARRMHHSRHDAAVVMCKANGPGVLTERDILHFVADYPGDTPVSALATRPLQTIAVSAPLIQARDQFLTHHIRHLGVVDDDDTLVGLLGFSDLIAGAEQLYLDNLRDALEQRDKALAQSRQNLQLAERVIESSLEGIITTDPQLRIQFVNPAFSHITGYTAEDVVDQTPRILSSGRHDAEFYDRMWQSLRSTGSWQGEIWNRRKGGELYLEWITITAIQDDQGQVSHYAGLFTDITQHRMNEERIRQLAYYDALTELPNRRLLEDRLDHAIRHAHRKQQMLAVMFVDLDHFKSVNDTHGHAAGDQLLVEVSRRLQSCLREDDTLARLGGDEFIVLLPELDNTDHARTVAQRLVDINARPYRCGEERIHIGTSIGISHYPLDGDRADQLLEASDEAMYRAKAAGRNQFRLAGPVAEVHETAPG